MNSANFIKAARGATLITQGDTNWISIDFRFKVWKPANGVFVLCDTGDENEIRILNDFLSVQETIDKIIINEFEEM